VIVPKGLEIVDQRLEAHGFSPADGVVLEGKVTNLETKKPLAARMRLELIEPQPKSGYHYTNVASVNSDAAGHWVLKKAPPGWQRVVIDADGFVPRVIGYLKTDGQPRWQVYDSGLSRRAIVAGKVSDEAGQPLAEAEVRFQDVTTSTGARYESALETSIKTGADGRFRMEQVPAGKATLWVHKPGYCRPGLGQPIKTPSDEVQLTMTRAGRIVVTVDFGGKAKPAGYMVRLEPEGGEVVGSFGGSGNIDVKDQITFDNVPPARYVVSGQRNPGSQDERTDKVAIDLKGGQTAEIKLTAK
jgi:hypothetical protein